jgi:Spy/CpxP family protein refolding chaperone
MGARGMGEGMEAGMGGHAAGMAGEGAIIARLLKAPKVAEELGLSQEQVKSLQEKLDALRKEVATLRIDLENASLEQARLLTGQTVDEAAVMGAVEKAGEISTKIAKLAAQQLLTVKKVLTPQQIEKAKAMMRERVEKERERFTGGRGGQGEGGDQPKWRRSGDRGASQGKEDSRPRSPDRGERTPPPAPPQNPM